MSLQLHRQIRRVCPDCGAPKFPCPFCSERRHQKRQKAAKAAKTLLHPNVVAVQVPDIVTTGTTGAEHAQQGGGAGSMADVEVRQTGGRKIEKKHKLIL